MTRSTVATKIALANLVVACALPTAANAQNITPAYVGTVGQDVGVMDRTRPAYDAKGIPLGGFRLFPALDVNSSYDDNVFRTNNPSADWFFTVSPTARLKSEWGRHFFEVYAGLNNYNYVQLTDENLTDWNVGLDGRVDILRGSNVTANAFYGEKHELWSSPNNITNASQSTGYQAAPNRFFQAHVDTAAVYQPNRLGFEIGGVFDNYNWTNTPTIGGGTYLDNNDRDQNEFQAYFKTSYDFSPGYSGFVKASYDERDYSLFTDRSGAHRSSHGYRLDGGVKLQVSQLVSGEIFLGYMQQNFGAQQNIAAPLSNVSGVDYGVQLDWYVLPDLTAHLSGKRSLDNVVLDGASIADNKSVAISADYEFRPNIILQARASYTNAHYVGSSRTDDYPSAGVGIKYLMNQYASFDLNYNFSNRSTSSASLNYTDNIVSVGITLHL